jgi:hypothetical protein
VREDLLLEVLRSLTQRDGGDEPVDWLRGRGLEIVHEPGGPTVRKAERDRTVIPASAVTVLTSHWSGQWIGRAANPEMRLLHELMELVE